MHLEEAIFERLRTGGEIQNLLGERIFPGQAPQGTDLPVCIYSQAYRQQLRTLTGRINCNRYTMHLDVWADDYATCKAVYEAIRERLLDFTGDLPVTGGAVTIKGIFEETGDEDSEPPIHGQESGLFHGGLDLLIVYGN